MLTISILSIIYVISLVLYFEVSSCDAKFILVGIIEWNKILVKGYYGRPCKKNIGLII